MKYARLNDFLHKLLSPHIRFKENYIEKFRYNLYRLSFYFVIAKIIEEV